MRQKSEEADRKRRMTMPLVYRFHATLNLQFPTTNKFTRMYESQSEELCGTVRGPDDDVC